MKLMKIPVPSTTVETPMGLEVCPACRRPIQNVHRNRFLTNLLGILDMASKNWTLREGYEWMETFREIKKSETLGLDITLPKDMFTKIKQLAEKEKGWGNLEQQLEFIEVLENSVEVEA